MLNPAVEELARQVIQKRIQLARIEDRMNYVDEDAERIKLWGQSRKLVTDIHQLRRRIQKAQRVA